MHRNSDLNSPAGLGHGLTPQEEERLSFAGQMTGVEGSTEPLGTGILAGINLARRLEDLPIVIPPPTTMLGGLYRYLAEADPQHFQPMNANFGLLDLLQGKVKKDRKKELLVERAQGDFSAWLEETGIAKATAKALAATHPLRGYPTQINTDRS